MLKRLLLPAFAVVALPSCTMFKQDAKPDQSAPINAMVNGRHAYFNGQNLTLNDPSKGLQISFTGKLDAYNAKLIADEFLRHGYIDNALKKLQPSEAEKFFIKAQDGRYGMFHLPYNAYQGTLTFDTASGMPSQYNVYFQEAVKAITAYMRNYIGPEQTVQSFTNSAEGQEQPAEAVAQPAVQPAAEPASGYRLQHN